MRETLFGTDVLTLDFLLFPGGNPRYFFYFGWKNFSKKNSIQTYTLGVGLTLLLFYPVGVPRYFFYFRLKNFPKKNSVSIFLLFLRR